MAENTDEVMSLPRRSSVVQRFRQWLRTTIGLDRAITFTIFARFWSSAAGLVTVALIAKFLSPPEQGYYYTFGSLVALQIVFELGFSFVILQMASHERAHLTIGPDYQISGQHIHQARLASILQKAVRWYSVAAVLLVLSLIPAGLWFFGSHQQIGTTAVSWRLPWCMAALGATLTFQIDPVLSFLEGCGYVSNVARLRLIQSVAGSLLAWAALVFHRGLFAPSMMLFGMGLAGLCWLAGKRKLLLSLMHYKPGEHRIEWGREVWPFQWRIAISWLCGYLLFQLFNPVLFAYRGPIAAGQMGMSLSVVNAMQAVALSWVSTKAAPFGALIAKREFARLDEVFFRSTRQAIAVCIAGGLTVWLGCVYLNVREFAFAHRLLQPALLAVMFFSTAVSIVVFSEAQYLRAHKQEKLLLNSVVGAICVALSTLILGKRFGAAGMVIGYCVLNLGGLAWATQVFVKYRRIWHSSGR